MKKWKNYLALSIISLSFLAWFIYPWIILSCGGYRGLDDSMKTAITRPLYGKRLFLAKANREKSVAILGDIMNYAMGLNNHSGQSQHLRIGDGDNLRVDGDLGYFLHVLLDSVHTNREYPDDYFLWAIPRCICWDGLSNSPEKSVRAMGQEGYLGPHLDIISSFPLERRAKIVRQIENINLQDIINSCKADGYFVEEQADLDVYLNFGSVVLLELLHQSKMPEDSFHSMIEENRESLVVMRFVAQLIGAGVLLVKDGSLYQRFQDLEPTNEDINEVSMTKLDALNLSKFNMKRLTLPRDSGPPQHFWPFF